MLLKPSSFITALNLV